MVVEGGGDGVDCVGSEVGAEVERLRLDEESTSWP